MNNLTVCDSEAADQHAKSDCINRKCKNCGVDRVKEYIGSDLMKSKETTVWYQWETAKIKDDNSGKLKSQFPCRFDQSSFG